MVRHSRLKPGTGRARPGKRQHRVMNHVAEPHGERLSPTARPAQASAGAAGVPRAVFVAANFKGCRGPGYLTEPAVMPATRKRWSSRKPTTIGTLTVSDAAMIWFQ
jgi:hypothetical protein